MSRNCSGCAKQPALPSRPGLRCTRATVSTITTSGPVAAIPEINELNIGHAIVAQAVFTGMAAAVADMKRLMRMARTRMIFGIGTDILKIERIAAAYERYGERFARRILMPEELRDFEQ